MIQQLKQSFEPQHEHLNQILVEFVIELQNTSKASNPQMVVKKIFELVKPKYSKCVEIILNLVRKFEGSIKEGDEESTVKELVENFANKQEYDDSVHLQKVISKILESHRSLSLLSLYLQIINKDIDLDDINQKDIEYLIELGLIVSQNNVFQVSNFLYEQIFNGDFIEQELKNKVYKLVSRKWELAPELSKIQKQDIVNIISENISELAKKTNNLDFLLSLILKWSKPDLVLLKSLLNFIGEAENKILLCDKEGIKKIANLVRSHFIENWQTKPLSKHFNLIQENVIKNKNGHVFWLLVTYRYILNGKEIPFKAEKEIQDLVKSKLILTNPENKPTVANDIYKAVFDEDWVLQKLAQINKPQIHNLLAWLNNDNFEDNITILQNKFPNNFKIIIEEIISWTHEHQDIAQRIIEFIKVGIFSPDSEGIDKFNKNIIYSPNLGNYLKPEDFKILITNRVAKLEGVNEINQTNQSMLQLTKKFRHNPLIIAEKILELTNGEQNFTQNLVDLIVQEGGIIKTEQDVNNIQGLIKSLDNSNQEELNMPTDNSNNNNDNTITLQELFERIAEKGRGFLKAILLVHLQGDNAGEILESSYNGELDQTEDEIYRNLIGRGSGGKALEDAGNLSAVSEFWNKFAEKTELGDLEYSIHAFNKGSVIVAVLNLEGQLYGVFYLGKSGAPRARLINVCEQTIPQIKKLFLQDRDFVFVK